MGNLYRVGEKKPKLQAKTVSVSTSAKTIKPDSGYDGLSQVTVNGVDTGDQNYLLRNIKIFNNITSGTTFECGFEPNIVMVSYDSTTGGTVYGWYASINGLNKTINRTIHRHTGYSEESGITINATGFTMNRGVGGDHGGPMYAVAMRILKK